MRHQIAQRKLNKKTGHRNAILRNLVISLFREERIRTTLPKAKELRSFAEKIITTGKKDSIHARRIISRDVHDREVLSKLFSEIVPAFTERKGGYTRIYKLGKRKGDNAEMALIELTERKSEKAAEEPEPETTTEKSKEKKAKAKK